ncbi:NAD(P)/FAD-dependent oxidoreductase [Chloroflexota bacterium]
MNDFDVVVIGAGPAGCYAALTAAVNGCRVAIFEEHGAIGWPRHDPGWLMESEFAKSVISSIGKVVPWIRVREYRVCNSESGDLIERSTLGGYLIRRDLLEKEVAALAIKAGASLFLKARVVKLVRKKGRVEGIETNSDIIPKAKGKIYICADGIGSARNGFALGEGACEKGEVESGIGYLLANADVSAGVIEHFLSSDPLLNYKCFFTHRRNASFISIPSSAAFRELKQRKGNVVSHKLRNAYALETNGYAYAQPFPGKYGEYFTNMVKDNIIFVGDASGGAGNIHGMIQGRYAGIVAASAIKENVISGDRLVEYQDLVLDTLGRVPFFYFSAREVFGSFNDWFREFEESTKLIKATELA